MDTDRYIVEGMHNLEGETWIHGAKNAALPILAASLLVFMRAFADFGTPLLIGEGFRTFPVEIYNQYLGENGTNHNFAAAISVIASP